MKKVMLVEDDATMVSLLNILLEMEGFEVVTQPEDDPEKILETIRQEKPALILMDVHLRQMNGLDLLRMIREEEDTQTVKVLMSSGGDFQAICEQSGADGFIMKPYMPDRLIEQIRQMVA